MTGFSRRNLIGAGIGAAAWAVLGPGRALAGQAATGFVCPPCGCAADGTVFDAPGVCPACGMELVPRTAASAEPPAFEPGAIPHGAGAFLTRGGVGREDKRITVHTYRPRGFTERSPILLVIPGSGRDGDEYRDSWIEASERHGVLIASPAYPETDYDFAAYHMGGVIRNLTLRNVPRGPDGSMPASLYLRDEDIGFEVHIRPDRWLFNDFNRIFHLLREATGSTRTGYDLFGHSAGGQILHRLALFRPHASAERIVAANSGFYTLPSFETPLPFGLGGTGLDDSALTASFACRLTLLLGGRDNDPDRGGQHLHTPTVDRQGLGRLDRGRHFFEIGRRQAARLEVPFNWRLEVVPGVGHDFRAMSRAAAALLYA